MKKITLLLLCFWSINIATAQYTEVINSKRPGFSESPYGVGTKVLQFEGGMFLKNRKNKNNFENKGFGAELFIRYGRFLENLEINLDVAYEKQKITNNSLPFYNTLNNSNSGVSRLTFAAKYLIFNQKFTDKSKEIRSWKKRTAFDKKRLIPSVGFLAGINTNFLSEDYKQDGISYKAAILLQNDFTDRFILITNLYGDSLGKDYKEYGYILTMTFAITPNWSIFAENKGIFKDQSNNYQIGGGAAYLFSKDLQLDASVRTNLGGNTDTLFAGIGASWRMDRHQDKVINKGQKASKGKKSGNMFSRMFGKKKKKSSKRRKKRK